MKRVWGATSGMDQGRQQLTEKIGNNEFNGVVSNVEGGIGGMMDGDDDEDGSVR